MTKKIVLLGTGIKAISHFTEEFKTYVKAADKVLYLVNEPIVGEWIEVNSKQAENLEKYYYNNQRRLTSYKKIKNKILSDTSIFNFIAVVLYGHPTIFADPGLLAINEAKTMGIDTLILPSISAQDVLFADMGIDPGMHGCVHVDATEFLIYDKKPNISMHVCIWQIGMIGNIAPPQKKQVINNVDVLVKKLSQYYPQDFEIYIYEASLYPGVDFKLIKCKLRDLEKQNISTLSTLYIPPFEEGNINEEMMRLLSLHVNDLE